MKRHLQFIISLIFLSFLCLSYPSPGQDSVESSQYLIWAHSDIQPKKDEQIGNFALAVNDIARNVGKINIAITAGDIPESKNSSYMFDWYLETRSAVNADAWYTIAGNHDWKNIDSYREKINPDLYYAVKTGNIIIIFLSNSQKGSISIIPEEVVAWWGKIVKDNQDKIIITVSHATLKHSGLIQARLRTKRLYIKNSKDFERIMKQLRVDIWLSGHSHLPGYLPYTDNKNDDLNGTVFIDLGAIRKDFMTDVESRILVFNKGSNMFSVKHRLHEKKTYAESRERKYMLPFAFETGRDEKPVVISRYEKASF